MGVPDGHFDLLGYTFGQLYQRTTGKPYIGMRPSKKSIQRAVVQIRELTAHCTT